MFFIRAFIPLFAFALAQSPKPPAPGPFQSAGELGEVLAYQRSEHYYGSESLREFYIRTPPGDGTGPSIMQRSGRKRLFDHNVLLRAIYSGLVRHVTDGSIGLVFDDAVFVDIGSAILNAEGAPTCRDLFEDKAVYSFFHRLIATDINDPSSRYVDTYFRTRNNFPFEVRAVPLEIDTVEKWDPIVQDRRHPIILRSANSGPDLYYTPEILVKHFKSAVDYAGKRPLLYLFGKYVLYKGRNAAGFEILGEVDYDIGFNHRFPGWTSVDWNRRTLAHAFTVREKRLNILQKSDLNENGELNAAISAKGQRSRDYQRGIDWQKMVNENIPGLNEEADFHLAEALTTVSAYYAMQNKKNPDTLATLAKFALTVMKYDYHRIDKLKYDPATGKVDLKI